MALPVLPIPSYPAGAPPATNTHSWSHCLGRSTAFCALHLTSVSQRSAMVDVTVLVSDMLQQSRDAEAMREQKRLAAEEKHASAAALIERERLAAAAAAAEREHVAPAETEQRCFQLDQQWLAMEGRQWEEWEAEL